MSKFTGDGIGIDAAFYFSTFSTRLKFRFPAFPEVSMVFSLGVLHEDH